LAGVGLHWREIGREAGLEFHVLAQCPAQQPVEFGHDAVEIQHLGTDHLATTEDQQLARERGRPLRRPLDLLDILQEGEPSPISSATKSA
jgi:hypothetical protein